MQFQTSVLGIGRVHGIRSADVTVVGDVVESERVGSLDNTLRFHPAVIVESVGGIELHVWCTKSRNGSLLVGEVLDEQVGGSVEGVGHA